MQNNPFLLLCDPTLYDYCRIICGHGMPRLGIQGLMLQGNCWFVLNVKFRSRKKNGINRIAGAGMNEQLVITGEAEVVPVLPGEGKHMQSPGWDGGCV